ncbi:hypothetical protein ACJX0J_025409 [Zea mays]
MNYISMALLKRDLLAPILFSVDSLDKTGRIENGICDLFQDERKRDDGKLGIFYLSIYLSLWSVPRNMHMVVLSLYYAVDIEDEFFSFIKKCHKNNIVICI